MTEPIRGYCLIYLESLLSRNFHEWCWTSQTIKTDNVGNLRKPCGPRRRSVASEIPP